MRPRSWLYLIVAAWLLTVPGCNIIRSDLQVNEHTQYVCKAGEHEFKPGQTAILRTSRINELRYSVFFDSTAIYELGNSNQKDWNKGAGVSFDLFSNHENSLRWAWRWVPDSSFFQLNLYAYVDGNRVTGTGHLPSVGVWETFEVLIYPVDRQLWRIVFFPATERERSLEVSFNQVGGWARLSGWYFGGDEPAPHTVYVYSKLDIK